MEKGNDGIINVSIPTVAGSVPLVILMKALGIEKDVDIHNAIYSDIRMDPLIYANIEDAKNPKILPPMVSIQRMMPYHTWKKDLQRARPRNSGIKNRTDA